MLLSAPVLAAVATCQPSHGSCPSAHFFQQSQNQPQGTLSEVPAQKSGLQPRRDTQVEMPATAKQCPLLGGWILIPGVGLLPAVNYFNRFCLFHSLNT